LKLREHQHFFLALRNRLAQQLQAFKLGAILQVDSPDDPKNELGDYRFALTA